MSKEFEKILLEKLDRIDSTLNEHTGILNEHTKTLNEHTGILNEHTKTLNEHTGILNEHTKTLNEHTEQFKMVRKDIYEINNKIIKSLEKMEEIEDVVEFNTQTIKKYHEESAIKFDVTFKACEQLNSKVDMTKCLVNVLKSKNYENEVRITALEDTIKQNGITA